MLVCNKKVVIYNVYLMIVFEDWSDEVYLVGWYNLYCSWKNFYF